MSAAESWDVAIIGAGVVGAAIARALAAFDLRCVLLDAADDVGTGTSKANTAILHTGFDAKPGSLESRLLTRGSGLLRAYAEQAGIAVERTGAVLVAWTGEQAAALPSIIAATRAATGTRRCGSFPRPDVYEREPALGPGALAGLLIPDESVIDPWTVPLAFATEAVRAGVGLRLGARVTGVSRRRPATAAFELATARGPVHCRWAVNAAGLGSDEVDRMFGGEGFTIRPRKGELIVYDKLARPLVRSIVLPVPTARTKGVLVAPTVFGNVLVGPTAEDVPDRRDVSTTEAGLSALVAAAERIVPGLAGEEVTATYAGLRAATEHPRLPDRRRSASYMQGRRHPVDRPFRVARHRRARRRPAGRRGAAAAPTAQGRRARNRRAEHALPRRVGPAAVSRPGTDRRRPRVRRDRLPLRAGDARRDPRRPGQRHRCPRARTACAAGPAR